MDIKNAKHSIHPYVSICKYTCNDAFNIVSKQIRQTSLRDTLMFCRSQSATSVAGYKSSGQQLCRSTYMWNFYKYCGTINKRFSSLCYKLAHHSIQTCTHFFYINSFMNCSQNALDPSVTQLKLKSILYMQAYKFQWNSLNKNN